MHLAGTINILHPISPTEPAVRLVCQVIRCLLLVQSIAAISQLIATDRIAKRWVFFDAVYWLTGRPGRHQRQTIAEAW